MSKQRMIVTGSLFGLGALLFVAVAWPNVIVNAWFQ